MKKCPVCGVEHSDIVPVCSICGSSLEHAEVIPGSSPAAGDTKVTAPAAKPAGEPKDAAPAAPDFIKDVQAAVSSVVSSAVDEQAHPSQPAPAGEPTGLDDDDDNPFVENVMKDRANREKKAPAAAQEGKKAPSEKKAAPAGGKPDAKPTGDAPKEGQSTKWIGFHKTGKPAGQTAAKPAPQQPAAQPAAPKAAAPAQRQQPAPAAPKAQRPQGTPAQSQPAAQRAPAPQSARPTFDTTAIAAASAQKVQAAKENAEAARQRNAQNPSAPESGEHGFGWSERKHKRGDRSNTPVIAAVCALLVLLIIAMLLFVGYLMTDDGSQPNDGDQSGNNSVSDGDTLPGDQEEENLPENDPNAEDNTGASLPSDQEATGEADQTGETETTDPDSQTADGEEGQAADGTATGEEGQSTDGAATGEEGQSTDGAATGEDGQSTDGAATGGDSQQTQDRELPAITETSDTVYATADVRVRDYPSTDGTNVINVVARGQAVNRTGTTATGWSRVEIGGTTGYIASNYLSATQPASDSSDSGSSDSSTAYATTGVNVRSTPNGDVVATLTQGQKVTLTGVKDGGWVQIQAGSITGYVYQTYLSSSQNSGSSDSGSSSSGTTMYATTGVNVRSAPGGNVVGTLTQGQKVTALSTSDGWTRIQSGDLTGYVYSSYLSTSKNGGSQNTSGGSTGSGSSSSYILPESNTRNYSRSELSSLSASQLRLARNEIYARHGRKFNDSGLQDYFNGKSWYKGTVDAATFDANITDYLNSYELANLQLILSLE